jgi:L-ascorbate metabolism protein UlaG (beta-lactamase superfamily)
MDITWLGHATVVLRAEGTRLITDPVLRRRVGPLVRVAAPLPPDALEPVDAVLLSHLHADHVDLPTLRKLGRDTPIVVPRPAGHWLRRGGFERVVEVGVGADIEAGGVRVQVVQADHDGRRRPLGPSAAAVGYVIGASPSAYFAGDTDLFDEMEELRGSVDVALLPVWGWGPSLGPGHLDPERAARAVAVIAPALAIPIHWGTLALGWPARRPGDAERPARDFAALVKRHAPGTEVRLLNPGERTSL